MKVLLAAGPLEGLSATRVRAIAEAAWRQARPEDSVVARIVSDGQPVPGGSSGLAEVIGGEPVTPADGSQPHIWRTDTQALLDYTSLLADGSQHGPGSSEIVGTDLLWAGRQGITNVVIALPGPSCVEDLGFGILAGLGVATPSLQVPADGGFPAKPDASELAEALSGAREALGSLRMSVIAGAEQHLTGFHGLARSRMLRAGLAGRREAGQAVAESAQAQARDARVGELVEALARARRADLAGVVGARLLGSGPDPRGPYAGAGGGTAFMLECLGARLYPVGDVTVRARLAADIAEAELLVYVASAVEATLPSGLLAAAELAGEAIPVVLVCDHGGFEAGELRSLPIAGAYELRPHLAFLPEDGAERADAAELAELLAQRTRVVARTWAY